MALSLKSVDYKDNDKMLTLFTLEKGLLSVGAKGVKKAGAKLRFCAQPFCFAEYVLSVKNDRYTVIGATEIESFYNVRLDVLNLYAASAIVEFIMKECGEGEPNEPLFTHTIQYLKKIAFGEIKPKYNLIQYWVKALEFSGYGFTFKSCSRCGGEINGYEKCYFDFESGGVVCEKCATVGVREVMLGTMIKLFDVVLNLEVEDEHLNRIIKFLNYYTEYKTGVKITCAEELLKFNV